MNFRSMNKKEFVGKTFDYIAIPTFTQGGMGITFMFRENWKEGNWTYGEIFNAPNFWMKDLNDEFQNPENLCKGLEYVDAMADCNYKKKVMAVITEMMGKAGGEDFCKRLGFLCELGCWENPTVRQPYLYNKEFYKYVRNCLNEYERYF